jgi:hypothetical protein
MKVIVNYKIQEQVGYQYGIKRFVQKQIRLVLFISQKYKNKKGPKIPNADLVAEKPQVAFLSNKLMKIPETVVCRRQADKAFFRHLGLRLRSNQDPRPQTLTLAR